MSLDLAVTGVSLLSALQQHRQQTRSQQSGSSSQATQATLPAIMIADGDVRINQAEASFGGSSKPQTAEEAELERLLNAQLPTAHVCFWALRLPRQTDPAVMARNLRLAITSCVAMDADYRVNASDVEAANEGGRF